MDAPASADAVQATVGAVPSAPLPPGMRAGGIKLQYENSGYITPGPSGVTVLEGASGSLEPGECHAIMGASGAGKSTLLDGQCAPSDSTLQFCLNARHYIMTNLLARRASSAPQAIRRHRHRPRPLAGTLSRPRYRSRRRHARQAPRLAGWEGAVGSEATGKEVRWSGRGSGGGRRARAGGGLAVGTLSRRRSRPLPSAPPTAVLAHRKRVGTTTGTVLCGGAAWSGTLKQGLTLVSFSAQLERFEWADRGCA
jgi:hypothetical protein